MAAVLCCSLAGAVGANTPPPDAVLSLEQTESLRLTDNARFVGMLKRLHDQSARLTPGERWHLRYLDAWQESYKGNYAAAQVSLKQIIDHADVPVLVTKASSLLMDIKGLNGEYVEAFALANRLATELPNIQDPGARYSVLHNLSQLFGSAGQHALAVRYAREMGHARPSGESACKPTALLLAALYQAHLLKSSNPQFQAGIESCKATKEPVYANTIRLILGSTYLDEGQPRQALALLQRIAPSIQANRYGSHILSHQVEIAQAHAALGQEAQARKAALAALSYSQARGMAQPESMRDLYQVLYRVEKKQGHADAALTYYEQAVTQNNGYIDDVTARALAYSASQQNLLAQRLQTERLSKQNSTLRLQQALSAKAVETNRLYLALLLLLLAGIVVWLVRLKRSQLRFKKLASLDGLTGIYNHQHFIAQAALALGISQNKGSSACLISIDLDHFKRVNDSYGHAAGDAVLKQTVALCQAQLRKGDLFGRLGGEEFGVFLQDCSYDTGLYIADRIRWIIDSSPVTCDGAAIKVSASAGMACTSHSGFDLQRLCADADAALYRAKRGGRNRVVAGSDDASLSLTA